MNVAEIVNVLMTNAKPFNEHLDFPTCPGIYSFILKKNSNLKEFGASDQVLYVGIAKDSLKKRDLGNHFNNMGTGRSTLRRSLGAILKKDLGLTAFSRNGKNSKREIINYTFDVNGEVALTKWILQNLNIGYWKDEQSFPYSKLRELEEEVIKLLRPTLDLDARTKKYNILGVKLDELRLICRLEAENAFK
ncbi:GIY-YIG nuclease family protein [Flavobacterium sp. MC2016-06]|jgi:hypothetical protein|uniref:GIY-YIG nuclease family protein n=1 Tax=Flavobacterium sp. MC2016-06 TaxID=2676308 RepID=UPI0012BB0B33|nr:hypothetical protein [Flavobacterium sp. MC2016-06]MBU3859080.1 hypothetical protein [Flavobacterium sp. MC2016-06]